MMDDELVIVRGINNEFLKEDFFSESLFDLFLSLPGEFTALFIARFQPESISYNFRQRFFAIYKYPT